MKWLVILLLAGCSGPSIQSGAGAALEQEIASPKVLQAAELLKARCPNDYAFSAQYINGFSVFVGNGIVHNGVTGKLFLNPDTIRNSSIPWLASLFCHEAEHVRLNHYQCLPDQEKQANQRQLPCLICAGGSAWEINYLMNQNGSHCNADGTRV